MGGFSLLQLGLLLLSRPALGARNGRVGGAGEYVLAVGSALAQGGPAIGVVVLHGGGFGGRGGNVVLEGAEVVEDVGYAGLPEGVYCCGPPSGELLECLSRGRMWPVTWHNVRPSMTIMERGWGRGGECGPAVRVATTERS